MNERTLIERLNVPWPEHETEEVTLPAWVLELCAEGAARIAALEAENERLRESLEAIIARSYNDPLGTSKVIDMRRIAEDAARRTLEAQEKGR